MELVQTFIRENPGLGRSVLSFDKCSALWPAITLKELDSLSAVLFFYPASLSDSSLHWSVSVCALEWIRYAGGLTIKSKALHLFVNGSVWSITEVQACRAAEAVCFMLKQAVLSPTAI